MPETDSIVASDASDNKRSGKTSKAGGQVSVPDRTNLVYESLNQAVGFVEEAKAHAVANEINKGLDKYVSGILAKPPRQIPEDVCEDPEPEIRPFCSQRDLDMRHAEMTYRGAAENAAVALRGQVGQWSVAVNQYEFALAQAYAAMQLSVSTAIDNYNNKNNPDSHSRSLFLYYTMKLAIATAVQTYEGSAASAGATLAGAAGSLLGAYQTYVGAISAAQSQRMVDEATAEVNFWQQVEQVLDAV